MAGRSALKTKAGRAEYILRTYQMALRQRGLCGTCRKPLGEDIVFGHSRTRGMGGGYRDDRLLIDGKWNNAALHWRCNSLQGSSAYEWRNGLFQPTERTRNGTEG
jgi:hypothetical protein